MTDIKRIFFYGSLRRGEYNHSKDLTTKHVADGFIKGAELVGGNAYPWIVESKDENSKVIGEVYDLGQQQFDSINRMEQGAGYELHPVEVHTEAGKIEAFAYYYGNPERLENHPRVPSGDWTKRNEGGANGAPSRAAQG